MKRLLYLISLLFLFSCSLKTRKQKFVEFRNSVNIIELPLTINCSFDSLNNQIDTNYFRNFIPEGFTVIGQLETNRNASLFLYGSVGDIIYPSVYCFSEIDLGFG